MKEKRFVPVKLEGAYFVLDISSMHVARFSNSSVAQQAVEQLEEGVLEGLLWREITLKEGNSKC